MNIEIEKRFVKDYIIKSRRDRIYYELSNKKKRKKAIAGFCHNAVDYLEECKIKSQGTNIKQDTLWYQ